MDVQTSGPKRDRPIFLDLLLIAAVMAFLMWGGLRLLARTHTAWDARNAERQTRAEAIRLAAESGLEASRRDDAKRRRDEAVQRLAEVQEATNRQEARLKNKRCLHGILFAEIDGVLTNIGRC